MIFRPGQKTLASPFAEEPSDEPQRAPRAPLSPFELQGSASAGSVTPASPFAQAAAEPGPHVPASPFAEPAAADAGAHVPASPFAEPAGGAGPYVPASPFAGASSYEGSMSISGESWRHGSPRSMLSSSPEVQSPPPPLPARQPSVGPWRSGVQAGDKAKVSGGLRRLHTKHSSGLRSPQHQHLPPVYISAVQAQSGETYLMTQTLARGSQGKFRICSKDGQYFGVKEYRLTPKEGATDAASPESIFSEWQTAALGGMRVHDMIVLDDHKVLVVTDLFDRTAPEKVTAVPQRDQGTYALGVIWHLAKHLDALHAQGILHRDIKPANVFLGEQGVALGDFGYAAALDEDGTVSAAGGTPAYMTFEMFRAQPHGPSADMWGLAMTWCALHGLQTPFSGLTLKNSHATFYSYEQWHASLRDAAGKVDVRRIPGEPRPGEFEIWDHWGLRAAKVDAPMFEHLLNGPAHPRAEQRPSMAEEMTALTEFFTPAKQRQFDGVLRTLRREASYALRPKSSSDSSTSSGLASYPVSVIKQDLQAFAAAIQEEEGK